MRSLKLISILSLFVTNALAQTDTTKTSIAFGTNEANASEKDGAIVYSIVEVMPEYPGGLGELVKFLKKELHYPKGTMPGRVFVAFIISETGAVEKESVKVVMGDSVPLNAEAIRVVSLMPNWKPGFQDNKPVRVTFTIPIDFHL